MKKVRKICDEKKILLLAFEDSHEEKKEGQEAEKLDALMLAQAVKGKKRMYRLEIVKDLISAYSFATLLAFRSLSQHKSIV